MTVLVFEDNLLWSSRLKRSLSALEKRCVIYDSEPETIPQAEVAIINLGSKRFKTEELVQKLKAQGTYVLAHAGHKETALLEIGRVAGCDKVATNSALTFKIEALLNEIPALNLKQ